MSEEAERLYEQARALDPRTRAAFVEAACRGDPRLHEDLVSLLGEAEAAEKFFDSLGDSIFSAPPVHAVPLVPPIDLPLGATVGRYRILALMGRGGMGVVYRAYDASLERDVALKFLPPLSTRLDDEDRLLKEARAAAALEHPNICTVHEIGQTEDGRPFIAMALYEGETLAERLRQGPLPLEEAVATAAQIARGLAAAHARGIVHRDVKPGNVILGVEGTVRLLDFGIAQAIDASLRDTGTTPGTAPYMSPEQVRGDPVDPRTDLWSLGVVLYEMLTGERPFRGDDDAMLFEAILEADPEPLSSEPTDVPPRLERIVEQLLQKDPDDRYTDASALLADLTWTRPSRFLRRFRIGELVAGTTALVALAGIAFWPRGGEVTMGAREPPPRYRSQNLAAYELFLRGDPTLTRSDGGFRERIGYLQQAIAIDSTYGGAYAGLAASYALMGDPFTNAKADLLAAAERSAKKALSLDDSLGTAYWALSLVRLRRGEYLPAEALIRRAIAVEPTSPSFHMQLARVHIALERPAEAMAEARRAHEMDPLSPNTNVVVAEALFANGRYDEALAQLQPVLAIRPEVRRAVLLAGKCYIVKGMWAAAVSVLHPIAGPEAPRARYLLGYALARAGQREEAQGILTELLEGRERGEVPAFDVSVVHAGLGDTDQAFAWLEKAANEETLDWETFKEPMFEDLHRDPRFGDLRQRMGR